MVSHTITTFAPRNKNRKCVACYLDAKSEQRNKVITICRKGRWEIGVAAESTIALWLKKTATMRYSILGFSQEKVLALRSVVGDDKNSSKLGTIDLLILRSISDLITNEKVFKHIIDGKAYSRVHYKAILEDLPILGIKKQALVDRIDKLCSFGLIDKRVIKNATGTWTAFCITERLSSILYKGRKVANKQSYSEKLKDPRWQRKRLEILSRDNYKCQMCGKSSRTLHVHHLFYKYGVEPWDYDNDTLVTLCEECHSKTHSK